MKEVDQHTGEDLNPPRKAATGANAMPLGRNPERPMGAAPGVGMGGGGGGAVAGAVPAFEDKGGAQRQKKRLTSPERFELKQLIASGILDIRDYPDFDEENGVLPNEDGESDQEVSPGHVVVTR